MKPQIQPTAVCYCEENCARKSKNSKESAIYSPSFRGGGEGNSNSWQDQSDRNKLTRPSLRFQKQGKQQNNKVKLLEKYNVFINSYYPTVLNNPSQDRLTKKLQKTCGNKIKNCELEKYENRKSNIYESTKLYPKNKNISKNLCEHTKFVLVPKYFHNDRCSEESNRTGFSTDSKTYTVQTESSNSTEGQNAKTNEMTNGKYVERLGKYIECIEEDCNVEETDNEIPEESVVCHGSGVLNCEFFSHLYERIEILEDLLLRTIDKTPNQEKKIKKSRKNQQTSTSKLELGIQCNEIVVVKNSSKEGKKMSAFDLELQKIKKRLRALEKKISDGKKNANFGNLKNPPSLNDISILTEELLRDTIIESEKCTLRGSEQNLSTTTCLENHSYSATAIFSQIKLDCAEYLRNKKLSQKEDERKKAFISKCKHLKSKCSSILNQKRSETKGLALEDSNKNSAVKTLPTSKKNELPLIPLLPSPSIKTQLKKKDSMTKIMYVNKRLGDSFMSKEPVKRPLRKKTKTKIKITKSSSKKQSKSSFLCQKRVTRSKIRMEKEQEEELQMTKSLTSVSSTNSKGNVSEKSENIKTLSKCVETNELTEPRRLELHQDYAWTMVPPNYNPGYWPPYPFWVPFPPPDSCFYHGFPCTVAQTENEKKINSLQPKENRPEEEQEEEEEEENPPDPVKILKSGGEIKIPVLFEQVQKSKNKKETVRKPSDISMRFVVMEEEDKNPLAPLRKIIKKLSRIQNKRTEHYVFGVTKCCCDEQCDESWRTMSRGTEQRWMFLRELSNPKTFMPEMTIFNVAMVSLVVFFAFRYWRKRNFYRLAAMIDGPKGLPVIGNAMEYLALDHVKILDYLMEITTKYNGLAKVWLGEILLVHISRPEDMEILLSSNKLIEKNVMYRFFDDVLGQGLLNARGDIWRKHRKIIAPTFHPAILKHFVKIFSEQSKILVKVLEKNADGKIFNVFPYVRNCALDFITETALENHIGAQLRVVAPATRAAERLMNITYNRMFKLWLYSDFIFYRTQQGKEYLRLRDLVKESTEPLLEVKKKEVAEKDPNRNTEGVKRKSFFRALVELNENNENFNDKELRDEVVTMIITGYETTAATIGFILVMLGIHQDVQAKVYEEVVAMQEVLKGRELEVDDLTHFEYMDRVIKETLRLYPVGPIIFRECTHDVKLTTCTIPKGASVAVVILKTHRDPSIWENPEEFNPDNFLPEKCEKRHPYAYIPFSAGPRNCIGKQYAYLSMRVMLYHILSKYKILCDLRDEDIKMKSEVTMKMVGGFKIRMLPRTQSTTTKS